MKNRWLFLFLSCTGTGYVFSMEQAVQSGNWFAVMKLIRDSGELELSSHVQVLLNTPHDLNTCTGNNDPSVGELDSGLFGVLLQYSFNDDRAAYALKELIRAKKIDISLPNNQAVIGALERGFRSVHGDSKPMPAYRSYLSNDQAESLFSKNIVFIVLGIVACACAYTLYTAQDEEDPEEVPTNNNGKKGVL